MNAVTESVCWRGLSVEVPVPAATTLRLKLIVLVPVELGSNDGSPVGTMIGKLSVPVVVRLMSWSRNWPHT